MIGLLLFVFLLLSALFSGSEIAFVSASKLRIELNRKRGGREGAIIAGFYDNPAGFLSTMLVGNNIALVVFTYLMTKVLTPSVAEWIQGDAMILLINTMLITIIVLIFGEYLPKTVFALYADKLLHAFALPLLLIKYLLLPPSWLMNKLSGLLIRLVLPAGQRSDMQTVFTRMDLENFVIDTLADTEKEIDTDLFGKALYLKKIKVRDCMVPRQEVEHVDISASIAELEKIFIETKLSRIVIIDGDIDNVLGYVHHQQLFALPASIKSMHHHKMPFIPEVMRVRDLLNRFIREHINIACVVDEYGSTVGIITLEDILEEIFGEIEDEHDQEELLEKEEGGGVFLFSGRHDVDHLNEKYGLDIPEGDYQTLSGFLVMTTATIPEQGRELVVGSNRYVLEMVSEKRIETVRVIRLAGSQDKEVD